MSEFKPVDEMEILFAEEDLELIFEPILNTMSSIRESYISKKEELPQKYYPAEVPVESQILENLRETSLRGLAGGIIITFSEQLFSMVRNFYLLDPYVKQIELVEYLQIGPKIHETYWAEAIMAASNYVRHGFEWREVLMSHELVKKRSTGSKYIKISEDFLKDEQDKIFKPGQVASINALYGTGGLMMIDLVDGGVNYNRVAEKLGLIDLELTKRRQREFLNNLHQKKCP